MHYRRDRTPGACYFFTVVTHQRRPVFADPLAVDRLRTTVREVKARRPFDIDAWVVLPDHIHAVWTMPPDDADYSVRWGQIKVWFSRLYRAEDEPAPLRSRRRAGERAVWQRRFWEHRIRDDDDFRRHVDYVHFNPVRHRLVGAVADWPWSSFHQSVQRGMYPASWAGGTIGDPAVSIGEPME